MRLFLPILLSLLWLNPLYANNKNGFDLSKSSIPIQDIQHGGPAKDGIPAIDKPHFITAQQARFLKPTDEVLGVHHQGIARAYPIKIMNWHEIVNDQFNNKPVSITFCPLCGTGIVYKGTHQGQKLTFGVSGLLYNSDVLLYDRQTQSLWSQILAEAISGKMKGQTLETIPISHTSWLAWQKKHPNTQVLSTHTGYQRDYEQTPYAGYEQSKKTFFPTKTQSRRYHPKERVLGLTINGQHKAYPFIELAKLPSNQLTDQFAGQTIHLTFDIANRDGSIKDANGNILSSINSFWFAWFAFHEDTKIFTAP